MSERWRAIADYGEFYEVSDQGRVRSVDHQEWASNRHGPYIRARKGRILAQNKQTAYDYRTVNLSMDGKASRKFVHRLVARAFLGDPMPGQVVNHRDFDTGNNRAANLEWVTQQENSDHTVRAGRHCSKLNESAVKDIRELVASGVSQADTAKLYRVNNSRINEIVHRKAWKHVT